MRSAVENVIYFYLFICIALLLFNVLYILYSNSRKKSREKRVSSWKKELERQGEELDIEIKRLRSIRELTAFHAAVSHVLLERGKGKRLFAGNAERFQELALVYAKRSAMERAFFAYVIASFHTGDVPNAGILSEIMLSYLEDSTVYCRENVLHALYALGREQAVEHAYELLHERGWYHNPKLLSDGLVNYTGDKDALITRLWKHRGEWEDFLTVGVVQFASMQNVPTLHEDFLIELQRDTAPEEVRFALVRYFQRCRDERARSELLRLLEEDGPLAVAAAAALSSYPGAESVEALKKAMHSRNWYIRRNAAMSLEKLGISEADVEDIRLSGDRYANEMLDYAAERTGASGHRKAEVKA